VELRDGDLALRPWTEADVLAFVRGELSPCRHAGAHGRLRDSVMFSLLPGELR
jgi:hypothetical protein